MFVISFCILINRVHIPPCIPFSTINNTSMSVKRFNFTLVFKADYYANPGAEKNFVG